MYSAAVGKREHDAGTPHGDAWRPMLTLHSHVTGQQPDPLLPPTPPAPVCPAVQWLCMWKVRDTSRSEHAAAYGVAVRVLHGCPHAGRLTGPMAGHHPACVRTGIRAMHRPRAPCTRLDAAPVCFPVCDPLLPFQQGWVGHQLRRGVGSNSRHARPFGSPDTSLSLIGPLMRAQSLDQSSMWGLGSPHDQLQPWRAKAARPRA
jgi:hypothetical protein